MKLTFKSRYLSLHSLPETVLPNFSLVTGVNGAGKTHLLRAIENGSVKVDIAPNHRFDVRYFDWTSFHPNDAQPVAVSSLYDERDRIIDSIRSARAACSSRIDELIAKYGLENKWTRGAWDLAQISAEEVSELEPDAEIRERLLFDLRNLVRMANNTANSQFISSQNGELIGGLSELLKQRTTAIGMYPILLEEKDFHGCFRLSSGDLFQQSLAHVFLGYQELRKINRLNRMDLEDGLTPSSPYLSETEFVERYGSPPWDFVNRALEAAKLDFRVDRPSGWTATRYEPTLKKLTSGAEVPFGALSSGEKVLMSFALCLYYSTDKRQLVSRPKLLLLDEVDAPLHPSMSKVLIDVVVDVLVKGEGVNVIMTTHSPSTAAVAPEGAIFTMQPGECRLVSATRNQAVSLLTAGIPVLAISFDGRRQVFVESGMDAERYEMIYSLLKSDIAHERSLVFIGVGSRGKFGDQNAGCDQVVRVVESLAEAGNISVFGIVDWDTKNESSSRIKVIGQGERYAIESCLLDPLLVAAAAMREDRSCSVDWGFEKLAYSDMSTLSQLQLQEIVNSVQRRIVTSIGDSGDQIKIEYIRGLNLNLFKAYLHYQGHDLEDLVKVAFPCFKRHHRSGELLKKIIDPVAIENPGFVPLALMRVMQDVLNASIS